MLTHIPTNLVTGFLGVGKTSAILDLLTQKPPAENWSVLVNEFGSIGIDGAIYAARGIAVKEVPGGCLCCAAGVPFQVAVNQLLKATRPQRLLIEPTGLGHPKRVLDTLRGEHFRSVLEVRASVCLVDPQQLLDSRYTTHENFIDQIAMADVLVANKTDLATAEALQRFDELVDASEPPKCVVAKTRFGRLDVSWLEPLTQANRHALHPAHHTDMPASAAPLTDGFQSAGWVFSADTCFDDEKLVACFGRMDAERIKAVVQTDKGWFIFNRQGGQLDRTTIETSQDNRLEIISRALQRREMEQWLRECIREQRISG